MRTYRASPHPASAATETHQGMTTSTCNRARLPGLKRTPSNTRKACEASMCKRHCQGRYRCCYPRHRYEQALPPKPRAQVYPAGSTNECLAPTAPIATERATTKTQRDAAARQGFLLPTSVAPAKVSGRCGALRPPTRWRAQSGLRTVTAPNELHRLRRRRHGSRQAARV